MAGMSTAAPGDCRACSPLLAFAAMPAAASADGLNLGLDGCPAQPTEHPFARWLDIGNYIARCRAARSRARWTAGS